jgi:hypothetical protein
LFQNSIFKWLAIITFGIFLPFLLLFLALSSHFDVQRERQKTALLEQMNFKLDYLGNYYSDEKFFHGLLQHSFLKADKADEPKNAAVNLITDFKRRFPGIFKFILIDRKGRVDRKNTDINKYYYLINQLFEIIKKLSARQFRNEEMRPEADKEIASKIAILRGVFGIFLLEKHLDEPLKKGYLGSCIRSGHETDNGLLWFQKYSGFSIICFINKKILNQFTGPELISINNNKTEEFLKLGYYNTQTLQAHGNGFNKEELFEIKLKAEEFSLSALSCYESKNFLLIFRQVAPNLVIFACANRLKAIVSSLEATNRILFLLLKWLTIIGFILYCATLRFNDFMITIRQKLFLIFLFTNGLPVLIMISVGYEYFEQKQQTMINSINNNSARLLKSLDSSFPLYVDTIRQKIDTQIDSTPELAHSSPSSDSIDSLAEFLKRLEPDEAYLFTRNRISLIELGSDVITSASFLKGFLSNALEIFNNSGYRPIKRKKTVIEEISDETYVYSDFLETMQRISLQNFGSGNRYTYLKLLGDQKNYNNWGILLVAWKPTTLMKRYSKETAEKVNKHIYPRKLLIMDYESENIVPTRFNNQSNVRRIMHRTKSRKLINENNLKIGSEKYVASSLTGIKMNNAVLMLLHPAKEVETTIEDIYNQIQIAAIVCLLFVSVVFRLYSGRFSRPVHELATGVSQVRKRNFNVQVPYESKDEFGQLIQGFNGTVAGMRELAVGTAIQESLLPPEKANFAKFKLFARSVFMNRMGGDYYDYYPLEDERMGVFFGDVAGHGIPAAVIMAMTKAIVAANKDQNKKPAQFLKIANSIFLSLKKSGWKRMMTGLCLELNTKTGKLIFANAGQCFPVIVGKNGKGMRYAKAFGMPLGHKMRKDYAESKECIAPGESLILYTDGIIEATNARGEIFAFDRFEKLLQNSWDQNLEKWWENIFAAYSSWAAAQDDDITFLMIRNENKND